MQINELNYELELLEKDYIEKVKHCDGQIELSRLIDLEEVIATLPQEIKKKNSYDNWHTQYELFMAYMQDLLHDIWSHITIKQKISYFANNLAIEFYFIYKEKEFCLYIPNFQALTDYRDALHHSNYELLIKDSTYISTKIYTYEHYNELKENLVHDLINYIDSMNMNKK